VAFLLDEEQVAAAAVEEATEVVLEVLADGGEGVVEELGGGLIEVPDGLGERVLGLDEGRRAGR
jgi:hypothetical protein